MDNISLIDFVAILVCALVNGFIFGYWWRDSKERRRLIRQLKNFPKDGRIDHIDATSNDARQKAYYAQVAMMDQVAKHEAKLWRAFIRESLDRLDPSPRDDEKPN